ncbi:MAG: hypothetical protein K6B14_11690 [Lachnospiraceae bacterium]|nr:hypothetical protein [Lachnospiraceae bacterium]
MAKSKSSQQVDLSTNTRTGINITSDLGFSNMSVKEPDAGISSQNDEDQKVDKLVDPKDNNVKVSANMSHDAMGESSATTKRSEGPVKSVSKSKSKLKRPDNPDREDNICKISANISEEAKKNLEKYAKIYGYKKLSPFLNDLLERLDLYMD